MRRLWRKVRVTHLRKKLPPGMLLHEKQRLPLIFTLPFAFLGASVIAGNVVPPNSRAEEPAFFWFVLIGASVVMVWLTSSFGLEAIVTTNHLRYGFSPFAWRIVRLTDIENWCVRIRPLPPFMGTRGVPPYASAVWLELTMKDGSRRDLNVVHPHAVAYAIERAKSTVHRSEHLEAIA